MDSDEKVNSEESPDPESGSGELSQSGQAHSDLSPEEQHAADHAMGGTYRSKTIARIRKDPSAIGKLFKTV